MKRRNEDGKRRERRKVLGDTLQRIFKELDGDGNELRIFVFLETLEFLGFRWLSVFLEFRGLRNRLSFSGRYEIVDDFRFVDV